MSRHLKVLPTSFFCYNSEKESIKFPIPKMKLNRINTSFHERIYNQMFKRSRENDRFLKVFEFIYLEKFTHSSESFTKCFSYLIAYRSALGSAIISDN